MLSVVLGAGSALSEPIKIAGLSWAEKQEEQVSKLRDSGYKCEDSPYVDMMFFSKQKSVKCKKDKDELVFLEDTIIFDCNVFKMCGMSIRQVGQSLVDARKITNMEIKTEWPNKSIPSWQVACGSGPDGDKVCIEPDLDLIAMGLQVGSEFKKLKLIKANYGGKKPGFD